MSQFTYISLGIVFFILGLAAVLLITDRRLAKKKIDHSKDYGQLIIKVICCSPSIVFLTLASEFRWWWAIAFTCFMVASWMWIWFDGLLGVFRKRGFWDSGSEDGKEDALTDNILQSLPKMIGAIIKITLALGTLYIYIGGLSK